MTQGRLLDWIERTGNRLPQPATLFAAATGLVMVVSQFAEAQGWRVTKPALGGQGGEAVEAVGLLDSDGLWWVVSHLVENFVQFPPLGLVLVGMLGIGVAERSGFLQAVLARAMAAVPNRLLTPATLFVGIISSVALDAGYIVLPPLAAVLYQAAGRSPFAGIAAVFAGVSAGFSANLILTGLDPLLAGFTQSGARILDPDYQVAVTANWWFMIVSTGLLTLVGWAVSAWVVEPRQRYSGKDTAAPQADPYGSARGVRAGLMTLGLVLAAVIALSVIPGAPLHGQGERFPRWVEATVPLLFILFLLPGLAYGKVAGTVPGERDAARLMGETMAALGPYIVLAFFAAQFIELFRHSRLGEMLAITGGQVLAVSGLPGAWLAVGFIGVVLVANLLIGSASAKYAFFAPVFVPMFMQAGISPELTQAAYRVGDSVSNIITPLNPYMVIILAFMQRYVSHAGIGTLVAMMLPYTIGFTLAWAVLLGLWVTLGLPLGPEGPLRYLP